MEDKNFMSLYDFLGHAAGTELGKAVYTAAKAAGEKPMLREVENIKYKGKIQLYRPEFLQNYFNAKLKT